MIYVAVISLLVLILLIFGFSKIFGKDMLEEDVKENLCQNSIAMRQNIPDVPRIFDLDRKKIAEDYSIECDTRVVNINSEDIEMTKNKISEEMIKAWTLFGAGSTFLFPTYNQFKGSDCLIYSRIHFDESVKDFYDGKLSLIELFENEDLGYLTLNGYNKFFNSEHLGSNFLVEENSLTFPKEIDVNNGDLLIGISSTVINDDIGENVLFFFQVGQEDYITQLKKDFSFSFGDKTLTRPFCEMIEGNFIS